jgi:succinate dehydrogenase hydrophobic anchor subunit
MKGSGLMILKKINSALSLLTILGMLLHIGYTAFCYLTFYYNPVLKLIFSVPFMVTACLHAILGMSVAFLQGDGTRLNLYPKQNRRTVLQRLSAALIFPMLILHLNTFNLMKTSVEAGQRALFVLQLLSEPLFFGMVLTHVATSFSNALITLGWISSRETQKTLDRIDYILCAAVFAVSVFAIIRGQLVVFAG